MQLSHIRLRASILLLLMVVTTEICSGAYLFETTPPYILTTYRMGTNATDLAWTMLIDEGQHPLDCVEQSISRTCELHQCAGSVGPYNTLDEYGDISQDAMIMDGTTMEVGAVGGLKHIKAAISVARAVMEYTTHSFLVGLDATDFAEEMGFPRENLRTEETEERWEDWKNNGCQPNSRKNVVPDPTQSCGPYSPADASSKKRGKVVEGHIKGEEVNRDTIGQIIVDDKDQIVVGVSTNGVGMKVPGRIGDSPIPGSGGYAKKGVGAAACTGQGDYMLRFAPSFEAVLLMELGYRPDEAAQSPMRKFQETYPDQTAIVLVGNAQGQFSAACTGTGVFPFVVRSHDYEETTLYEIDCEKSLEPPENGDNHAAGFRTSLGLLLILALVIGAEYM